MIKKEDDFLNRPLKSPLNWVGNKIKYIDVINEIVSKNSYNSVIDACLGTGNIILNVDTYAEKYIGNDKNKLTPKFYQSMQNIDKYFSIDKFDEIISKFNNFLKKENYYEFRDYWNSKFAEDKFDYEFMYETVMLLKMCSNSMVRFNSKGYFNQGFRGLAEENKSFFTESSKNNCVKGLNDIKEHLTKRNYIFLNDNFKNLKELNEDGNLLIFDPPYIFMKSIYDTDYNDDIDMFLINFLRKTENKFLLFNYLKRDGKKNEELIKLIEEKDLKVKEINSKTLSGQNRKNTKEVKEVMIYN